MTNAFAALVIFGGLPAICLLGMSISTAASRALHKTRPRNDFARDRDREAASLRFDQRR